MGDSNLSNLRLKTILGDNVKDYLFINSMLSLISDKRYLRATKVNVMLNVSCCMCNLSASVKAIRLRINIWMNLFVKNKE